MKTRIKDAGSDRVFNGIVLAIALFVLIIALYPLIYVVSAPFSSPYDLMAGRVWLWPVNPHLEGYRVVFTFDRLWLGLRNSLFITGVGTTINLIVTIIAAYPLSRKDLKYKKPIMMMFVFTMLFSGGLIPNYLLVRDLGLLNSHWALMIPNAMSMFNFMVMRTFFMNNIPDEVLESTKIDGCTDFRFIWSFVLPLSKAIIAVMVLYYAVAHWNSFFNATIYLTNRTLQPLQVVLREVLLLNQTEQMMDSGIGRSEAMLVAEQMKYSLIVISSIPLLIAYPFVQRHFVKGVMIGSVKG